ncbi:MAG: DUF2393 family protein [Sulfurospirillum sp.]|nr:DUF2393 family protein [Sulfurospirillum sp.]MBL0702454.1 DUF2393 family protein [Sulfurospirillum sp.]
MTEVYTLKASILNYIINFTVYDYVAYAWLLILFFVTILVSILLAKRSTLFSMIFLLLSLLLFFMGPFALKKYLDKSIRPLITKTLEVEKLIFSNSLIVTGSVKNISKNNFTICNVNVNVLKNSSSEIKNIFNKLKPFKTKSMFIKDLIVVNETKEFRVVFDNYVYSKEIDISIKLACY